MTWESSTETVRCGVLSVVQRRHLLDSLQCANCADCGPSASSLRYVQTSTWKKRKLSSHC